MATTQGRYFTVRCKTIGRLEKAVKAVERSMNNRIGNNAISYQITGQPEKLPWDTGYITDDALDRLQRHYTVIETTIW